MVFIVVLFHICYSTDPIYHLLTRRQPLFVYIFGSGTARIGKNGNKFSSVSVPSPPSSVLSVTGVGNRHYHYERLFATNENQTRKRRMPFRACDYRRACNSAPPLLGRTDGQETRRESKGPRRAKVKKEKRRRRKHIPTDACLMRRQQVRKMSPEAVVVFAA